MNKCKYCGYTGTNDDMAEHAGEMCHEKLPAFNVEVDADVKKPKQLYLSLQQIRDIQKEKKQEIVK